jgi:hypothetical protein
MPRYVVRAELSMFNTDKRRAYVRIQVMPFRIVSSNSWNAADTLPLQYRVQGKAKDVIFGIRRRISNRNLRSKRCNVVLYHFLNLRLHFRCHIPSRNLLEERCLCCKMLTEFGFPLSDFVDRDRVKLGVNRSEQSDRYLN